MGADRGLKQGEKDPHAHGKIHEECLCGSTYHACVSRQRTGRTCAAFEEEQQAPQHSNHAHNPLHWVAHPPHKQLVDYPTAQAVSEGYPYSVGYCGYPSLSRDSHTILVYNCWDALGETHLSKVTLTIPKNYRSSPMHMTLETFHKCCRKMQ